MTITSLLRRRDRAASALEFVLVMPIVVLVMFAVADFGNAMQQAIRMESAARAGAQIAFSNPTATTQIRDTVRAHLGNPPLATSCVDGVGNGVCITPLSWCQCGSAAVNYANRVDCDTEQSGCTIRQYVSITVTRPYSPLIVVPVTTLRGNVEVRVL
ncbi:pilus assembly protein [Roseomonas sp. PWR1]|uniref:Pilus assembly protein n=1 Tax=Roseomonas nitratireducens TaxID=2820810 RepID=A0ABS4ATK8_9PROT|nr:TadE/TadG family type IV pilus assembly protein [Neoroseomonas nitratireducens]MBP0464694.1 pilus assembly protein [Neoroseomonas nitratireducens]